MVIYTQKLEKDVKVKSEGILYVGTKDKQEEKQHERLDTKKD